MTPQWPTRERHVLSRLKMAFLAHKATRRSVETRFITRLVTSWTRWSLDSSDKNTTWMTTQPIRNCLSNKKDHRRVHAGWSLNNLIHWLIPRQLPRNYHIQMKFCRFSPNIAGCRNSHWGLKSWLKFAYAKARLRVALVKSSLPAGPAMPICVHFSWPPHKCSIRIGSAVSAGAFKTMPNRGGQQSFLTQSWRIKVKRWSRIEVGYLVWLQKMSLNDVTALIKRGHEHVCYHLFIDSM